MSFRENTYLTKTNIFLGGILLAGLVVRLWGITSGLPDLYMTDEVTVVTRSLQTAKNHLDPQWVVYPSLWFYVLDILYGAYYIIGSVLGQFSTIESFALQYFKDPTYFYLLPRLLSSVLGLGIPILALIIGTKFFSKEAGLLAALLLTFNGAIVEHSHYATLDIPATFFTTLALYTILNVYRSATCRNYVIAGLTIGLGMSIKYLPVIAFGSLIVCHIFLCFEKKTKTAWLILAGFFLVIGFLAGTPFFIKNASSLFTYVKKQHMQTNYLEPLRMNFGVLIKSIGWLSLIIFLLSTIYAFVKKQRTSIIVISFVILYFFSISMLSKSYYERWHLPYLPALYLVIAMSIYQIYQKYSLKHKKLSLGILCTLCTVLISQQLFRVISFNHLLTLPDTRIIAKKWVESNIPAGSGIFLDSGRYLSNFSVPIRGMNIDLGEDIHLKSAKLHGMEANVRSRSTIDYYNRMATKTNYSPMYRLVRSRLSHPLILSDTISSEWLRSNHINYAILSSYYFRRFYTSRKSPIPKYEDRIRLFYETLFRQGEIMATFEPDKQTRGPHIFVLHLSE